MKPPEVVGISSRGMYHEWERGDFLDDAFTEEEWLEFFEEHGRSPIRVLEIAVRMDDVEAWPAKIGDAVQLKILRS